MNKILITGGLGFIGSSLIKQLLKNKKNNILNIDKVSKVSSKESLNNLEFEFKKRYKFKKIDIVNSKKINEIILNFKPTIIFNLAAESHVDNSILSPKEFINSNIVGTFNLLNSSKIYFSKKTKKLKNFRFVQISTDEVYGSLNSNSKPFKETDKYFPNSPYSASKAASEHLVRAWNKTYNIPVFITNCSNNFGPWQFPEKLIPVVISKALSNQKIPVYGNGKNIRDWIYVDDHSKIIIQILKYGKIGENYNIGANYEITNIDIIKKICKLLNKFAPSKINYYDLIKYVKDRPGHDYRYAIDNKKISKILKKNIKHEFDKNLEFTVKWYIKNIKWLMSKSS